MGACLGKSHTAASWPDLLPEITDLVLRRLPDHADRLSFGAVCHEWRLAARSQPLPPAMPYVNLAYGVYKDSRGDVNLAYGAYKDIGGGKARPFPTPNGYRVRASLDDGWLFYYHESSRRCFLRRPFFGAAIELPRSLVEFPTAWGWELRMRPNMEACGSFMDMKMVVCSSRLVVALFRHHRCASYLASFRPAQPHQQQQQQPVWSFVVQPRDNPYPDYIYTDIAFYDGKVFALSCSEQLFCHDVDGETNQHLPRSIVKHASEARPAMLDTNNHLVISADKQKLLMVRWRSNDNVDGHLTMDVWVFEADFRTGRWLEVKDLGGQVLFIGRSCSLAFAAGSMEHWGPKFQGGNRVFVVGSESALSLRKFVSCKKDSYYVYNMVSGETSLVSLKCDYLKGCTLGWFFPTSENL